MKQVMYNLDAKKTGDLDLKPEVFGVEMNHDLVYQVVVSLAANRRKVTAHSKTRGEVRGGGRKPWKQKGTGNARTGSIRNPIFRGGGIVFGPRNEVKFNKKVNRKMRQRAFLMALASKVIDKELVIVESAQQEKPATKQIVNFLDKTGLKGKKVLMGVSKKDANLEKSLANIDGAGWVLTSNLNCLDCLNNKFLVLDKASVDYLHEQYGKAVKKSNR